MIFFSSDSWLYVTKDSLFTKKEGMQLAFSFYRRAPLRPGWYIKLPGKRTCV